MKKVEYYEMSYRELEELVKKTYGQYYSFVADIECNNDSEHSFDVDNTELLLDEKASLEDFITTGNYFYIINTLLNDMSLKGIIPYGNYLITVCW
jgi:hypothetical protein